jgi:uncharacterized damage-inducible protein DinB
MYHMREEVIQRTIREFNLLDQLVVGLTDEDWQKPLLRPEGKDPWTVKDALAHITYWKAYFIRTIKKQRRPVEERGLETNATNHLIYLHWHDRSPSEVLAWHRQVQDELLTVLNTTHEAWFSGKKHTPQWPYDLDGHSAYHRSKDIQRALAADDGI